MITQAELDFMHNFSNETDGSKWAKQEIEYLRQRNSYLLTELEACDDKAAPLLKNLADARRRGDYWKAEYKKLENHIKRDVILRDALEKAKEQLESWEVRIDCEWGLCREPAELERDHALSEATLAVRKALAATTDLKDVILCHAEPVGIGSKARGIGEDYQPLYRAWEPKP